MKHHYCQKYSIRIKLFQEFCIKNSIRNDVRVVLTFWAPSIISILYLSPKPSKTQTIKTSSPATDHLCFIICGHSNDIFEKMR